MISMNRRETNYVVAAILIVLTCVAYWHLFSNGFIDFDDNDYVTKNFVIQKGLTLEGLKYAFTFKDIGYWHPLTWISMMLDYQLFGLNPTGYHLENLFWHIVNSLLLYHILSRLTGKQWLSVAVASIFALHPINVEAVAWLVERKTVMSTVFFLTVILLYMRYTEKPSIRRYVFVLFTMVLGLMIKSSLTILPILLLLLDIWPLGRLASGPEYWKRSFRLVLEKIPLFVLSIGSVYISMLSMGKRTVSFEIYPLHLRLENALISTIAYIGKLFWPAKLIIFYPLKPSFPVWQVAGAAGILLAISMAAFLLAKKYPWFVVGWLWYLASVLPVSGLLQAGLWPAMADRFAYTPFIGLYIIVVWGLALLVDRIQKREAKLAFSMAGGLLVVILVFRTSVQAGYWQDTVTLFEHAFTIVREEGLKSPYPMPPPMMNYLAKADVGRQLADKGRLPEAIKYLSDVLADAPQDSNTHNNLAVAYERAGDTSKALYHYNESLKYKQSALIHTNLGLLLARNRKIDEAIPHFREALRIDPKFVDALINLGGLVAMKGNLEEGLEYIDKALIIDPRNEIAKKNADAIKGAIAEKKTTGK